MSEPVSDAELDRLEALRKAAASEFDPGRLVEYRSEDAGQADHAAIWYDDGDLCAEVHDNLGRMYDADAVAEYLAESANAVPRLIAEIRRLRGK